MNQIKAAAFVKTSRYGGMVLLRRVFQKCENTDLGHEMPSVDGYQTLDDHHCFII